MVKCPVDTERARIGALSATAPRRNQCQTAKEVMAQLNGVEVNEKKGGNELAPSRFTTVINFKNYCNLMDIPTLGN